MLKSTDASRGCERGDLFACDDALAATLCGSENGRKSKGGGRDVTVVESAFYSLDGRAEPVYAVALGHSRSPNEPSFALDRRRPGWPQEEGEAPVCMNSEVTLSSKQCGLVLNSFLAHTDLLPSMPLPPSSQERRDYCTLAARRI